MHSEAKQRFLAAKRSEGLSDRTLTNYREALDQFMGHFLAEDPTLDLPDVTADDIRSFLLRLRDLGRSEETRANRWRTLRNWFNWCKRERILKVSPAKNLHGLLLRPQVVTPYTREEVQRLMLATRRWPQSSLRDQAIIALLYNTGIRAGELCTLKPECVREGTLKVIGKGKRERWVGVEPITQRLLLAYMADRTGRYVFNLSVGGLYRVIRRLAWEAKVPNAYVHRFRDTFAVAFLENGGDVEQLQTILGHADINTTLRYVMFNRSRRATEAQRQFAPFAVRAASRAS